MNNIRRRQIREQIEKLQDVAQWLEPLAREEDEYRDNMPENLHESERYAESETASEKLDEIADECQRLVDELEEIL